jgi:hypothetical protein
MVWFKTLNQHSPFIWFADLVKLEAFLMILHLFLTESFGGLLEPFFMPYDLGSLKKYRIMSADQEITLVICLMPLPASHIAWIWLLLYSESLFSVPITLTNKTS